MLDERKDSGLLEGLLSEWYDNAATSDLLVQLRDDQKVHCHKLLLCSWSEVWRAALTDQSTTTLELIAHDASTARKCLRYCYTGQIALTHVDLVRVHNFALCYHLQSLQSHCEAVMQEQLAVENCVLIYSYLFGHSIPNLATTLEAAKRMICTHFFVASQGRSFCDLSPEALCEILKEQEMEVVEDDILRAFCRWLDKNKTRVKLQMQEQALQLVRFSQLSPKVLVEFKSHELMKQSPAVMQHYHLGVEWRMIEHAGTDDRAELQKQLAQGTSLAFGPRSPSCRLKIDSQIVHATRRHTFFLHSFFFPNSRNLFHFN